MDLRQLRYFQATAEELHFQRAARRVNLSQPALSQQIKQLETELGVTLLDRDRRRVALTEAGRAFLARVTAILAACDEAVREAREIGGREPQVLRLGFVGYLNLGFIARSIAALQAARPEVQIEQIEMPTPEVYAALKERRIDLGFAVLPVTHPSLVTRKVAEGCWTVVVPGSHAFAGRAAVPVAELKGQPLIVFDRSLNPPLYDTWIERFADAGFTPTIALHTKQVQLGLTMAQEGLGLFLVASYIVPNPPADLVKVPLSGFDNRIGIAAAWHEDNRSTLLQNYLKEMRKALDKK